MHRFLKLGSATLRLEFSQANVEDSIVGTENERYVQLNHYPNTIKFVPFTLRILSVMTLTST